MEELVLLTITCHVENLQVAIDVTANGKLPLPPYSDDSPSQIFNITIFLSSYTTGKNFTISNGTASRDNASLGEIMAQESGSTVKHVNWVWPDCLVGNGQPDDDDSDRGAYNVCSICQVHDIGAEHNGQISIRQNFRLNGDDHYTIFDVPISVTNSIESSDKRPSCDVLTNKILSPEEIDEEAANSVGVLFAPGDATKVDVSGNGDDDGDDVSSIERYLCVILTTARTMVTVSEAGTQRRTQMTD